MRTLARKLVLNSARKLGYEIRKAPFPDFVSAPVFDLSVQFLMLKKGESIRFIQAGANDGKAGDPIRKYILKYNWTGVLVEPQPSAYKALKSNYAGLENRLFFENVAITDVAKTVSIYRAKETFHRMGDLATSASCVASVDPTVTSRQLMQKPSDLEEIIVPTARLDDLVTKYGLENLDILQIDTEGHEWHVLQTLDFVKTTPSVVQFECGHMSPKDIGTATRHLNSHGYFVYFGGHEADSVAMHRSLFED